MFCRLSCELSIFRKSLTKSDQIIEVINLNYAGVVPKKLSRTSDVIFAPAKSMKMDLLKSGRIASFFASPFPSIAWTSNLIDIFFYIKWLSAFQAFFCSPCGIIQGKSYFLPLSNYLNIMWKQMMPLLYILFSLQYKNMWFESFYFI